MNEALEHPGKNVTPPSVCIAGALLIVVGVDAAIHIVWSILHGTVWLNLAFLGIPVGFGLLSGNPSSRFWSLVISGGSLILFSLIGIWFAAEHARGQTGFSASDLTYAVSIFLLVIGGCAFVFRILLRRDIRDWFALPRDTPASGRHWAVPVLLVGAFFGLLQTIQNSQMERTIDELFPVEVTVIPFNAETGEGISNVSWEMEGDLRWKRPGRERLQKLNVSTSLSRDGFQLKIKGVADRPRTITVFSTGFDPSSLEVTRRMESVQRLPMLPKQEP